MIRKLLLSAIFLSSIAFPHDHIPYPSENQGAQGLLRFISKMNKTSSFLAEYSAGKIYTGLMQTQLKLGYYKRFKGIGKFGFFILNKTGQRHGEDWVLHDGHWEWENTENRNEQEVQLNYTTSFRKNLLVPLVFTFKPEITYNFYNSHSMFVFTPSINYFILKRGRPRYSFHTRVPVYIPLNFEGETIYKSGVYQSILFHKSRRLILGATLKYFKETWNHKDSKDFTDGFPDESYVKSDVNQTLVFELIYKI